MAAMAATISGWHVPKGTRPYFTHSYDLMKLKTKSAVLIFVILFVYFQCFYYLFTIQNIIFVVRVGRFRCSSLFSIIAVFSIFIVFSAVDA